MRIESLPIARIYPREDIQPRKVVPAAVDELVKSIQEVGLLSPIIVRPARRYVSGVIADAWEILAGHHRYEACSRLHWESIDARIAEMDDLRSELAGIDENLVREQLSEAQRAYAIGRRKEIYEALHPETVHGGNLRGDGVAKFATPDNPRFTKATAKATGRSERSVQLDAERADALGDDLTKIAGTSLDKGVELDALAKMSKEERAEVISLAERGEKVSARKSAPDDDMPTNPIAIAWGKANQRQRAWFVNTYAPEIRALLKGAA